MQMATLDKAEHLLEDLRRASFETAKQELEDIKDFARQQVGGAAQGSALSGRQKCCLCPLQLLLHTLALPSTEGYRGLCQAACWLCCLPSAVGLTDMCCCSHVRQFLPPRNCSRHPAASLLTGLVKCPAAGLKTRDAPLEHDLPGCSRRNVCS